MSSSHRLTLRGHRHGLFVVLAVALMLAAPASSMAKSSHGHAARSSATSVAVARHGNVAAEVLVLGSGYPQGGSGRVRSVQRQLAHAGYKPGPIDGLYGPLTQKAVRGFQQTHGLAPDGIVGPKTRKSLGSPSKTEVLAPGSGYRNGGSGKVRDLQRRLKIVRIAPGRVDGLYGPRTERAVARFQHGQGLPVDGVAGPVTRRELRRQLERTALKQSPSSGRQRKAKPKSSAPASPAPAKPAPAKPTAAKSSHGKSNSSSDATVLVLAVTVVALWLLWFLTVRRHLGRTTRRRRFAGDRTIGWLRLMGFRYDYPRNAYILRFIGKRWGPVIRYKPNRARHAMLVPRHEAWGIAPEETQPPPDEQPAREEPAAAAERPPAATVSESAPSSEWPPDADGPPDAKGGPDPDKGAEEQDVPETEEEAELRGRSNRFRRPQPESRRPSGHESRDRR